MGMCMRRGDSRQPCDASEDGTSRQSVIEMMDTVQPAKYLPPLFPRALPVWATTAAPWVPNTGGWVSHGCSHVCMSLRTSESEGC